MAKFSLGLALGGGGARGLAHIGVLRVLQKNGIVPDIIGGTSAGALVGAMYAATLDPKWVETQFRTFLSSDLFAEMGVVSLKTDRSLDSALAQAARFVKDHAIIAMSLNRKSFIKKQRLVDAYKYLLPVRTFEELKIPLNTYTTDLNSGETIRTSSGDLLSAIVRSSSIPGFVEPTEINGKLIVDGGVSAPIPVTMTKKHVDFVIAVDVSRGKPAPLQKVNVIEIVTRADRITGQYYTDMQAEKADFVIHPDVLGLHWSEFDEFEILVENGIIEAEKRLYALKQVLKYRNSWRYRMFHLSTN